MSLQQILAWVMAGQQLVGVGAATVDQIRGWIKAGASQLSEADLNAILAAIAQGAARHKALADADLGTAT